MRRSESASKCGGDFLGSLCTAQYRRLSNLLYVFRCPAKGFGVMSSRFLGTATCDRKAAFGRAMKIFVLIPRVLQLLPGIGLILPRPTFVLQARLCYSYSICVHSNQFKSKTSGYNFTFSNYTHQSSMK